MNILHTVEFYEPSVGGAQQVVKQISESLVALGHTVTVATSRLHERQSDFINGVRVVEFEIEGNGVRGFRGETSRYREFLLDGKFDILMNYAAQQWATDLVFPILNRIPYPKVLSPCGFSGLYDAAYTAYFAALPDILKRYDHLVFHSDSYRDIEYVRRHGMAHYSVIPNGAARHEFEAVDTTFRSRHGIPDDVPLLLTVGTHTGVKGHSLVIRAFRKARIGGAVLVVIGNIPDQGGCFANCQRHAWWAKLSSNGQKRVLLLNPPRTDVVAAFHAADLFLLGSNIECSPIVLFEAMASRTPFLTVECGNAAEIAAWSGGGVVVSTDKFSNGFARGKLKPMARAIEESINEPDRRARMAAEGLRAWQERFTWETIALQYERLYHSITTTTLARKSL